MFDLKKNKKIKNCKISLKKQKIQQHWPAANRTPAGA
jgi:hypothetical protein